MRPTAANKTKASVKWAKLLLYYICVYHMSYRNNYIGISKATSITINPLFLLSCVVFTDGGWSTYSSCSLQTKRQQKILVKPTQSKCYCLTGTILVRTSGIGGANPNLFQSSSGTSIRLRVFPIEDLEAGFTRTCSRQTKIS